MEHFLGKVLGLSPDVCKIESEYLLPHISPIVIEAIDNKLGPIPP